ncbi:DUF7694 domain-containing protein [Bradyrhizobium icense]|uniref:DUF7694 domain-containing protein n=1 Tax=Bradyrhizobium icense TaxID=1274631 RepID=UPI0012EAF9D5|nr:hypothetical protein [Bradyrhizobium icense]
MRDTGIFPDHGADGRFIVQGPCGCALQVTSATEAGWEHVSVNTDQSRSPNWQEMCFVKDLFWDEEECVMQLHPPLSQYVKTHPYCLHLWKPLHEEIPVPPTILVGVPGFETGQALALIAKLGEHNLTFAEETIAMLQISQVMGEEGCSWETAYQRWKESLPREVA